MADVTRERTGELIQKLLRILAGFPDGLLAREALEKLSQAVTLTPYEAGEYGSGGRRFEKIVRFATVDCVKAGWLAKSKGVWAITPEGRDVLAKISNPGDLYREATRLYRKWKSAQPEGEQQLEQEQASKVASITLDEAEELAWAAIENYLKAIPPYEFQHAVGDLLKAMGYHVAWVAPPGKDGGLDLIAYNDPLGTKPPRIKVQVKRNFDSAKIDVSDLRSFLAVIGPEDVGLFVALSGFTKDAEAEARQQSSRQITLIGMERFVELWTEHYAKLDEVARQRLPLRPVWFLAGES
jgi:restriction system protein